LERSLLFACGSDAGATVAIVIRSATAVATATFACIALVSEFATAPPPVASEVAMFARVVSESAAGGRVFNERGDTGMRDAGGSTFAAILVDFPFFLARWALSRTRADDGFSVFAAIVDLISIAAELVLNDAGFGSIG
jgi:hypothetical protein